MCDHKIERSTNINTLTYEFLPPVHQVALEQHYDYYFQGLTSVEYFTYTKSTYFTMTYKFIIIVMVVRPYIDSCVAIHQYAYSTFCFLKNFSILILRSPSSTPVERSDFLQLLEVFVARCFKAVLPSLKDNMLYYALICGTVRMLPKNSQVIYDGFLLLFGQVVQIRVHDLGSTPSFDLGRGSGEVPSYTVSQVARKIL
ncbi:hypothetical protein BDA99DRAFT_568448 [Phascolomyces articulosus]|uniref:Uncharacterized protein n=1 Tax=Phascolomyces articulosus TaxID=60185 RepID=A0AAD5KNC6_9FUNG|nr:hypothetical protein BDA99DRAFT_568448 [Phascolomyces articulosus]